MHRASYCNVYISRPTRCTNSYNVSLFIIKCSTCFARFSPSSIIRSDVLELYIAIGISRYHKSGSCTVITAQQPHVPAYTNCDIQLQNIASDDGLKSPKHVEHLMINKDIIRICASSWSTYIHNS